MKNMEEKKYNNIELNNEVTKRKDNGFFNLEKDQEAEEAAAEPSEEVQLLTQIRDELAKKN